MSIGVEQGIGGQEFSVALAETIVSFTTGVIPALVRTPLTASTSVRIDDRVLVDERLRTMPGFGDVRRIPRMRPVRAGN